MKLSEEERQRRIASFLEKERQEEARWYYLSFVDPDRSEGNRFLGVCWVKAGGPTTAIQSAHVHGINPGGQVAFVELPFLHDPPEGSSYKLHRDRDEIDRLCQIWKDQDRQKREGEGTKR